MFRAAATKAAPVVNGIDEWAEFFGMPSPVTIPESWIDTDTDDEDCDVAGRWQLPQGDAETEGHPFRRYGETDFWMFDCTPSRSQTCHGHH